MSGVVDMLMSEQFNRESAPHSTPYKLGAREMLRYQSGEVEKMECPYIEGTVNSDAYFAGAYEARRIWSGFVKKRGIQ
jgi:hypothetical protein